MAANGGINRVSPLKPGLRGARNWAAAQMRATAYSKRTFWRFWIWVIFTIFIVLFGALWLGGFLPNAQQATDNFKRKRLMAMGFVVERIDVTGEGRLRESDVRKALGVEIGDYMFEPDLKSAQERVESIGWVDYAVVRRLWPNRIVVQIIEREPYALWQNQGQIKLVNYEGDVISDVEDLSSVSHYRLIVGEDAPVHFASLDMTLKNYPSVDEKIASFIRYPSGRWDIVLKGSEIRIKLPSENLDKALSTLVAADRKSQLLNRKVSRIDLRLPDRISLLPATETRA